MQNLIVHYERERERERERGRSFLNELFNALLKHTKKSTPFPCSLYNSMDNSIPWPGFSFHRRSIPCHSLLDNPHDQWQLDSPRTSEHRKLLLVCVAVTSSLFSLERDTHPIRPLCTSRADLPHVAFQILMIDSRLIRLYLLL